MIAAVTLFPSRPGGPNAAPAAHERFEFPERSAVRHRDRAPHGHSAYADETYPTVPDQHYPAEPEPAYRGGRPLPASGECTRLGGFAPGRRLPARGASI